jgi:hypothetical protein
MNMDRFYQAPKLCTMGPYCHPFFHLTVRRQRHHFGSAPIDFDLNQRISIRPLVANNQLISLYLSRDEYDDAVAQFSSINSIHDQPFMPSSE